MINWSAKQDSNLRVTALEVQCLIHLGHWRILVEPIVGTATVGAPGATRKPILLITSQPLFHLNYRCNLVAAGAADRTRTGICSIDNRELSPLKLQPRVQSFGGCGRMPATEKIMEAATGDKEFWVVDVVGNFCFVHPAKAGIATNLNLITDKGNIYSFTLQDVSDSSVAPDLKVLIEPADHSSLVASSVPAQFVPAAQWSNRANSLRQSRRTLRRR